MDYKTEPKKSFILRLAQADLKVTMIQCLIEIETNQQEKREKLSYKENDLASENCSRN